MLLCVGARESVLLTVNSCGKCYIIKLYLNWNVLTSEQNYVWFFCWTSCCPTIFLLPLVFLLFFHWLPVLFPSSSFCRPKTQKHFTSPLHCSVFMCVLCSQPSACRCPWTAWRRGSGPSPNRWPTLTCCNFIWIICEWQPRNEYRLNKQNFYILQGSDDVITGFTCNLITIL